LRPRREESSQQEMQSEKYAKQQGRQHPTAKTRPGEKETAAATRLGANSSGRNSSSFLERKFTYTLTLTFQSRIFRIGNYNKVPTSSVT